MRKSGGRLAATALALMLALAAITPMGAAGNRHHVVLGDTLWGLAHLYSVSVDTIAQLNHLADPNLILVGQLLEIPGGNDEAAPPAPSGAEGVYEVQPGDTLGAISLRFNVSIQAIQAANHISDANLIIVGQRLTIPEPQPDAAPLVPTPLVRPVSPDLEGIIEELAAAEGLDAGLVKAVAWVESGWQQGVVSPAGAVGVMQIMPETAAWLEAEVFGYPLNEDTSVYDNVKAATRLLRMLLDATGNVDTALAAYYQGYGVTQAGILYEETAQYVRTVQAFKALFWP